MNQLTIIENPAYLCTIAKAARKCLHASPYKFLQAVSCECNDGVLTLKGHLVSFYEKQIAQETVCSVEGAKQVVNEIEVEYGWE
jgi:osmotically-inducible protein OsmY